MRRFIGIGFAVLALGVVDVQAQDVSQCFLPSPASNLNKQAVSDDEFGLKQSPDISQFVSPHQSMFFTNDHGIGAEEFVYDQNSGQVTGIGNVRIESSAFQMKGETVQVSLEKEDFTVTNMEFGLYEPDLEDSSIRFKRGRGFANQVKFSDEKFHLESTEFSLCPEGNDDVVLSASEITLDLQTKQGIARNSTIKIKGSPVVTLPYLRFPIGSERLSGFLYPKIGAGDRLGGSIEVPYYFNLAKNQDATLTTAFYSRRGFQLQNEHRYLGTNSDWTFIGEYMPRDRQYINQDRRYGAELVGKWHDGGSVYSDVDLSWVSDETYFNDYSGLFSEKDKDYLLQNASLSYANHGWLISVGVNRFLTSQPEISDHHELDDREPYDRVPWIVIDHRLPLAANSALTTRANWDSFRHDAKPDASRFHLQSILSTRISSASFATDLSAGGEYLQYRLTRPNENQRSRMSVQSAFASLDGKLIFEKFSASDSNHHWTLAPRIKMLAAQEPNQANLPQFDTTLSKLDSYDRIFEDSIYIGGDRLRDTSRISVGVSADYYNLTDSSVRGSFGVGQVFYPGGYFPGFNETDSSQDDQSDLAPQPSEDIHKSDLFLKTRLETSKSKLEYSSLVSTKTNKISSSSMRLSYALTQQVEFSSVFRHLRDGQSKWGNAFNVEFDSDWLIGLQFIRSFDPDQLENSRLSLEYQSCCLRLGLAIERDRQLDGTLDNSVLMTFDLTPSR